MGMPGYQTPAETADRVETATLVAATRLVVATVLRLALHSRGLTALPHKDELQREG